MARHPPHSKLVGKLVLDTDSGTFLGDTRIRLLEAIAEHGSISQAAKAVPLSYKAAWDAVDAMNNLADQPLVERSVGGQGGGGTLLTDYGRRMVAFYRAMEEDYQGVLDRVARKLGQDGTGDVGQYRKLIRRLAMKTSARNQFVGPISALREGAVNFEVCLRLDERSELAAIITRESAEHLGLAIGKEVHAFVKAQSVILLTDPAVRITARNQLWGTVSRIHAGAVNDEITVTLPGGRLVVAIVTHDSVQQLGLAEGAQACALFKASSVILATFE
jgi:molybdate transport system regulatory protein